MLPRSFDNKILGKVPSALGTSQEQAQGLEPHVHFMM